MTRPPVAAGRFYPAAREKCQRMASDLMHAAAAPGSCGTIVPHAGWIYSGPTAALGLAGIAAYNPETVVIFGAVHGPDPNPASLWCDGNWETPIGDIEIDEALAAELVDGEDIVADPHAHRFEHSIEVQLPLLHCLLPQARFVPVSVRPGSRAPHVGAHCARKVLASGRRVAFVGSTDLTHYGPVFDFEPHGRGEPGIRWAMDVNDRRFIDLVQSLRAEEVCAEAAIHRNACGAGAVAALLAAMRALGCTRYQELRHTCSADVKRDEDPDPQNSVGYESGVFLPT